MPIELVGVSHHYGDDSPVLQNVSMLLEPGVVAAVMGPSGSGKSTLLAIAGLLLQPSQGDITYSGQKMGWRQLHRVGRQQVAWVFQSSNLLPRRTALENTMMGPFGRGRSVQNARRDSLHALTQLGIEQLAGVPVRYLSGGEAQRVGIARALASHPTYLFADEPTGQLDTLTTSVVLKALVQPRSERAVTLIATHDPAVARRCDRVYRVTDGSISREA